MAGATDSNAGATGSWCNGWLVQLTATLVQQGNAGATGQRWCNGQLVQWMAGATDGNASATGQHWCNAGAMDSWCQCNAGATNG